MRSSRLTVFAVFLIVLTLHSRPTFAASCESLAALSLPNTTISAAQLVAAGTYVAPVPPGRAGAAGRGGAGQGRGNQFADLPAFCRVTASIKPSSDSDIKMELWMPASGLERQVCRARQRRLRGHHRARRAWPPPAQRVRRGHDRHGTRGWERRLHDGPSRTAHRLRRPRDSRNGGQGQGDRGGVLRQRTEAFVLQRLLDRRPPGADGRTAIPRRLRRHRRRRAGDLRVEAVGRADLDLERDAQGRCELPDAGQRTRCCTMRSWRSATCSTA